MGSPEQDGLEIGKEVAKETVKQLFGPLQEFALRLFGSAATEIGLGLQDSARLWRLQNYLRVMAKAKAMLEAAGAEPEAVHPRLLFPIRDYASLEDDEDLQKRWAALLSNAARTDFESEILPAFPDILRQLTSEEAQFLDRVEYEVSFDELDNQKHPERPAYLRVSKRIRKATLDSASPVMLGNLQRLFLLTTLTENFDGDGTRNVFGATNYLHLSAFGKAFVRACQSKDS